jgi:hypothetical protein
MKPTTTVADVRKRYDRSEAEQKFERLLCNNQYLERPLTFTEMFDESMRVDFDLDKFYEEYPLASRGREDIATQTSSQRIELLLELSSQWQSDPDDLDFEPSESSESEDIEPLE